MLRSDNQRELDFSLREKVVALIAQHDNIEGGRGSPIEVKRKVPSCARDDKGGAGMQGGGDAANG